MADLATWKKTLDDYEATAKPATMAGHGRLENSWRWSVVFRNEHRPEVRGGLVGPMSSESRARELAISRAIQELRKLEPTVRTEISCCGSCVYALTYGADEPGDGDRENTAQAMIGLCNTWGADVERLHAVGQSDPTYSSSDCEGCGNPKGGDRYPVVGWLPW